MFEKARNARTVQKAHVSKFRCGKFAPVSAIGLAQAESATIQTQMALSLDPIAGNLLTPIGLDVVQLFVPNLAMHAFKNPDLPMADSADLYRSKLVNDEIIFGLEPENEITKRMNIKPVSISGSKMVNETARLSYLCAVNYLSRLKHRTAFQHSKNTATVLPALFGSTALDRLNAVLNPDERLNGEVALSVNSMRLPVEGIGFRAGGFTAPANFIGTSGDVTIAAGEKAHFGHNGGAYEVAFKGDSTPIIEAIFDTNATGLSMSDLYRAEKADALIREMDRVIEANPGRGQELALQMSRGLKMDNISQPMIMYQTNTYFGQPTIQTPTDGPSLDGEVRSHTMASVRFAAMVPATEFGGVVVTLAAVKPDETFGEWPDPYFSEPTTSIDYLSEEMSVDPVKIYVRDLDSDCNAADENTVVAYTGLNEIRRNYAVHGLDRHVDPDTVVNKNALFSTQLPLSVTPDNVFYPDDIDHYAFVDNAATAEPVNLSCQQTAGINTPRIYGPTPLETISNIDQDDLAPIEQE